MSRAIRFRRLLANCAALAALALFANPSPLQAQLGAPELIYQNGSSTLNVEAPADLRSLTITSDRFSNYYQLFMECPVRKSPVPTAYTYDCTIKLKGKSTAPPGIAGAIGSGTAHLILYLQTNDLGSDLDFHNDQFVMTLPNKHTFTYFPGTMAFAKGQATQVKVKIATTQSCIGAEGEGFAAQQDVAVKIAGKTYTSNANGVIEAEVPSGTQTIEALWKDYALGYVAVNGIRQRPNEDGKYTVDVGGSSETLEVRMFTCDPDGQPKTRALLVEIGKSFTGPAVIRVLRGRKRIDGFVGLKLRDGDQVTIGGTAKLKWLQSGTTIAFEDPRRSSLIVIGPDTTPAGNKEPESRSVFQLIKGIIEVITPESEPDVPRFTPSGRTVVAAEKGTRYTFGYDPATQTGTVIVREGSVLVLPRNLNLKPVTLQAGQQVAVSAKRVGPLKTLSGVVVHTNAPTPAPPELGAGTGDTRSAHGCVGFDGTWQGPGGTMSLRDGSGPYGGTTLRGTVSGNVLRGTYYNPSVGQGTFAFTLAPGGDSFTTVWTNSNGVSGSYDTVQCVGP